MESRDSRVADCLLTAMFCVVCWLALTSEPIVIVRHYPTAPGARLMQHEREMERQFKALAEEAKLTREVLLGVPMQNAEKRLRRLESALQAVRPDAFTEYDEMVAPPP